MRTERRFCICLGLEGWTRHKRFDVDEDMLGVIERTDTILIVSSALQQMCVRLIILVYRRATVNSIRHGISL